MTASSSELATRLVAKPARFRLDRYDLRARLFPALLAALPLPISIVSLAPGVGPVWASIWGLISYAGGTLFVVRLARDSGKRLEEGLFLKWGGRPTTRLLRHRDAPNKIVLSRYHHRLAALIPELRLPSAREELLDPRSADDVYDSAVKFLIARTRGDRLLFEENCNYGFTRNLLGLRTLGRTVSTSMLVILLLQFGRALFAGALEAGLVTGTAVVSVLCAAWWMLVNEDLVRRASQAYAERLLETLDRTDL